VIENTDKYVFSFIWKVTQPRVSDHLKLFETFVMSYVSQVQNLDFLSRVFYLWPWSQMDSSHGNKSLFQLGDPSYHACLGLQDLYILDLDLGYSLYLFFFNLFLFG